MRVGIDCRKIADFGIGTYARGLLQGLASMGERDEYVAFVPSSARELVPRAIEPIVVEVPNYTIRELPVMGRAIARAGLDVFHSAHYVVPWTSCPTLTTIHDMILFHFPPKRLGASAYLSWMTRRALRKSARVLTVSEAAKRSILEQFPGHAAKIVVTPNGVDALFFEPREPAADLGRYLLFVGNDKPHKNVAVLIEAFARLPEPRPALVLAGGLFERYRSTPGVVTTGFVTVERLASLYRGAVALVMPSLEEGFGLPVVEAMASGTPVLASDIPSLVEIAGGAAVRFDPRSPESLVAAMVRVLNDDGLRRTLSAEGRAHAATFTWLRCAELTREAYRAVAAER